MGVRKNIINFNDKLYLIKRTIPETQFPIIEAWKEYLRADTVLKKDGIFFFCDEIKDAEIIDDDDKN